MSYLIFLTLTTFMIFGFCPMVLMIYATMRDRKARIQAESAEANVEESKACPSSSLS